MIPSRLSDASSRAAPDPTFVPDRLIALVDRPILAEDQEAVEPLANQRSCVTATTVPSKASSPSSSASADWRSRLSVGSSSNRRGGTAELEQQDLKPRLPAPGEGLEGLFRRTGKLITVQRPGCFLAVKKRPPIGQEVADGVDIKVTHKSQLRDDRSRTRCHHGFMEESMKGRTA